MDSSSASTNGVLSSPALTDSFRRGHSQLRISLTEKCNLRCESPIMQRHKATPKLNDRGATPCNHRHVLHASRGRRAVPERRSTQHPRSHPTCKIARAARYNEDQVDWWRADYQNRFGRHHSCVERAFQAMCPRLSLTRDPRFYRRALADARLGLHRHDYQRHSAAP